MYRTKYRKWLRNVQMFTFHNRCYANQYWFSPQLLNKLLQRRHFSSLDLISMKKTELFAVSFLWYIQNWAVVIKWFYFDSHGNLCESTPDANGTEFLLLSVKQLILLWSSICGKSKNFVNGTFSLVILKIDIEMSLINWSGKLMVLWFNE